MEKEKTPNKESSVEQLQLAVAETGADYNKSLLEETNEDLPEYKDISGFCKSVTIEEIRQNNYILTPGRYVGMEEIEDDSEPFEEKMERLTKELSKLFKESKELEEQIRKNLEGIGYEL